VQQQQRSNEALAAEIFDLKQQQEQFAAQAEQLRGMQREIAEMRAALVKLHASDELVAQR
jgi:prefoldin subunit 5